MTQQIMQAWFWGITEEAIMRIFDLTHSDLLAIIEAH